MIAGFLRRRSAQQPEDERLDVRPDDDGIGVRPAQGAASERPKPGRTTPLSATPAATARSLSGSAGSLRRRRAGARPLVRPARARTASPRHPWRRLEKNGSNASLRFSARRMHAMNADLANLPRPESGHREIVPYRALMTMLSCPLQWRGGRDARLVATIFATFCAGIAGHRVLR